MDKTNKKIFGNKGFTLMELLIVLVIIAILSSVAVPIYLRIQNRAKESATKAEMSNIATALELYGNDNNAYPSVTDIEGLADELDRYIHNMNISDSWGMNYNYSLSAGRYTLASGGIDKTFDTEDDIIFSNGMMVAGGMYQETGHDNPGNTATTTTIETATTTTEDTSTTTIESTTTTTITDETTTTLPDYPLWSSGTSYSGGSYVIFDGKVFVARNWTQNQEPGLLESPWQEVTDEWRFFNVYSTGDEVIVGESTFVARNWTQNNEPGLISSPWQEVTDEWRFFNVYNKNDIVIYEGREYIAKYYTQNNQPDISSAWRLLN